MALALAAVVVLLAGADAADAPADAADAAGCPAAQKRTCVAIPASKVLKVGNKPFKHSHNGLPYVIVKGVKKLPRAGTYVEIPAGRHDPAGFGGVVVASGSAHGLGAIAAAAPLPSIVEGRSAARRAFDSVCASAGGSLLDLLLVKLLTQAAELMGAPQCSTGVGDFPLSLTGLSLDPKSFSLSGPVFSGGRRSSFGLSASVSPTAQLKIGVKEQAKCEWKKEPASIELPPPPATFFAGPAPYIVRVAGEASASGSFDWSASGTVSLGTTLSGGLAYPKGALQFSPTPSVTGRRPSISRSPYGRTRTPSCSCRWSRGCCSSDCGGLG